MSLYWHGPAAQDAYVGLLAVIALLAGVYVVCAKLAFLLSLEAIPLAEAVAVFFVSPFLIGTFSVVFLDETVGPRRWAAIVAGGVAVSIVLRPGTKPFQWASLPPIVAAAEYGLLHIVTRRTGASESAASLVFWTQTVMLGVAGCVGLVFGNGCFEVFSHPYMAFWPALGCVHRCLTPF